MNTRIENRQMKENLRELKMKETLKNNNIKYQKQK